MAWYGTRPGFEQFGLRVVLVYWGVFALFLLLTLYMVLLDFRHIRMEYKLGERALFEDTLGDEEFREAIRRAREEAVAAREGKDSG